MGVSGEKNISATAGAGSIPAQPAAAVPQHTPTPWRVVEFGAGQYRVRGKVGPIEVDVATVHGGPDDAVLIVTACNTHEGLVAFVREIARHDPVFAKGAEKKRIADARALLSKATQPVDEGSEI